MLLPPVGFVMLIFAVSKREKFNEPVGCDLLKLRENGHVNVGTTATVSDGKFWQCMRGTTVWWNSALVPSKRAVPLI